MSRFTSRAAKKYAKKNFSEGRKYRESKPYKKGGYRRYYHEQPSRNVVYVEEPDSEEESEEQSESDDEEEVYEFELDSNQEDLSEDSDSDSDSDSELESESEGEYGYEYKFDLADLNDELENEAIDMMEAEGDILDLNDELVRYYDESSEDEFEPEDILDIIDLNDQLQAEALRSITNGSESEFSSESESETASFSENDIIYSSDSEDLDDQLQLENIRQNFVDRLVSDDEISISDIDSGLESEEFLEIDSEVEISSDEEEFDAGNPENYDFDYDSSDSDSSEDEGITIYKHRFDLPDSYDSENDSTDEELVQSDDAYADEFLLRANDSEDEIEVVDLSKDLENSKDCELVELNDKTYKLSIRFPSLIRDELKIDFLKKDNELVVSGKFNFVYDSESDSDYEDEDESDFNEWSGFEGQSNEDSEDSEEDSDEDSEEEIDEELKEDAESLIQEFQKHEIQFEKRFQFDKIIKGDEIKAKYLSSGELEIIIPNEGTLVEKENESIPVSIDDEVAEEEEEDFEMEEDQDEEEEKEEEKNEEYESTTEEIAENLEDASKEAEN